MVTIAVLLATAEAVRWIVIPLLLDQISSGAPGAVAIATLLVLFTGLPLLARRPEMFRPLCLVIASLLLVVCICGGFITGLVPVAAAVVLLLTPLTTRTPLDWSGWLILALGVVILVMAGSDYGLGAYHAFHPVAVPTIHGGWNV
jgi:hypothetical protein